MPTMPYDGGTLGASDATIATYTRLQYPNPFFDLSRHYFPKSVKTLFKYCRIYYYQNEFIHNIITKLASYPITDFIYDQIQDETVRANYQELADHYLKLKAFLVECGLDYNVYGNCIVSANMKFKRFLQCPICQDTQPVEDISYKWQNFEFVGECKACNNNSVRFKMIDRFLKNPKYFKLIRWAPENINIDYNELTGEMRYFYTMNEKTRKGILNGKRDVIERVPQLFIKAIKENKKIELDSRNLYHFKRPTLAEEDQGWGKPLLLPAMKMLWYMQTLRRGNEAIVADHLIPMRSIFPSAQGNLDPFTQLNLGQWRGSVEDQILKWRKDPNSVGIFPIPIGYQSLGGDARVLMVTPELKYLEESVINSMGVPIEFIKGGSTWTSSSVSLRIVENMFLNYREQMEEFLNYFVVPKIKYFLGYPPVKVRLKKFKMQDDLQAKELLMQLAQLNKISDSTLLEEFGIDPVEERKVRKSDSDFALQLLMDQAKQQAESQGRGQVILSRYQTEAQMAAQEQAARVNEGKFQVELVQEMGITDAHPSDVLQKQAIILAGMPQDRMLQYLQILSKKAPHTYGFLVQRLQMSGILPSAMEQRAAEQEQAQVQAKVQGDIEKAKVEGRLADKEHDNKMEETDKGMEAERLKMKHEAQRHEQKVVESKLPQKKPGSK